MKSPFSDEVQSLASVFQDDLRKHLIEVRSDPDVYGYAIIFGDQGADQAGAVAAFSRHEDLAEFDDDYRDEAKFNPDEWQRRSFDAFPKFRERFQVLLKDFQQTSPDWDEERRLIDELRRMYLRVAEAVVEEGGFGHLSYRVLWTPGSSHPILAESARRLNSPEVRAAAQCIFDEDLG
ncbi:DUF4303 domain-containing protein [Alienimonas chondri]|uniref:DUF4303 domain-containing protein n=1 Tax=Alienimonas chondri TaxID=2681879 RepID=A0ABX1VJ69_9PLAN|nr:DUF4303 domain-containing protein [Alienimonas chondri]NNJ27323.1 hypothetical protein [Alienimonas chondri]